MTTSIEPKVSRKKQFMFGVIATVAAASVYSLVLVRPPVDPVSNPPAWLNQAGAASRIEQIPGLYRERAAASGAYLEQFNSPIVSTGTSPSLLSLVR